MLSLPECRGDSVWCRFRQALECYQRLRVEVPAGSGQAEARGVDHGKPTPITPGQALCACCVPDGESSFLGVSLPGWHLGRWEAQGRAGQERGHRFSRHGKDLEPQDRWRRPPGPAADRVMRFVCTSVVGSILTPGGCLRPQRCCSEPPPTHACDPIALISKVYFCASLYSL